MSEVLVLSDGPKGSFSRIKLDDGKTVLLSVTPKTVTVMRLRMRGLLPVGRVCKHESFFLATGLQKQVGGLGAPTGEFMLGLPPRVDRQPSFVEALTDVVVACQRIDDIPEAMTRVASEGRDIDKHEENEVPQDEDRQRVQQLIRRSERRALESLLQVCNQAQAHAREFGKMGEEIGVGGLQGLIATMTEVGPDDVSTPFLEVCRWYRSQYGDAEGLEALIEDLNEAIRYQRG